MHVQQAYGYPSVSMGIASRSCCGYKNLRMFKTHSQPSVSKDLTSVDSSSCALQTQCMIWGWLNPRMKNLQIQRVNCIQGWNCKWLTLEERMKHLYNALIVWYRFTQPPQCQVLYSLAKISNYEEASFHLFISHLDVLLGGASSWNTPFPLMDYLSDLEGWNHIFTEVLCQKDHCKYLLLACAACLSPSLCLLRSSRRALQQSLVQLPSLPGSAFGVLLKQLLPTLRLRVHS